MTGAAPPCWQTVVRASAGSGKTYRITSQYVALLHRDRGGVAGRATSILATTFTRKAAGEILGRLLGRLAQASRGAAEAEALRRDIGARSFGCEDARGLLAGLCGSIHQVAICTLDSFLSRMAMSFRHELGLPPRPTMADDDDPRLERIRRRAIEAMLADDDLDVMLDLLRRVHHDPAAQSVTRALGNQVRAMYEVFRQAPAEEAWSGPAVPPGLLGRGELERLADELSSLAAHPDLPGRTWSSYIALDASKVRTGAWEWLLRAGFPKAICEGRGTFGRVRIEPWVESAYRPVIAHARAVVLGKAADMTRATHALLRRFDRHYTRIRREQGLLLYADLPLLLQGLVGRARHDDQADALLQEMYYRLDRGVNDLLLDEHQDTSVAQWDVIRPFAEQVAGTFDGSRVLCVVGDVKQAIYGWRGGCSEIFNRLGDDLHLPPAAWQSMEKSYRSSQVVLDAVNRVFGRLGAGDALAGADEAVLAPERRFWLGNYKGHEAHHRDRPGHVLLCETPQDEAGPAAEDPAEEDTTPDEGALAMGGLEGNVEAMDGPGGKDGLGGEAAGAAERDEDGGAGERMPSMSAHERCVVGRLAALAQAAPRRSVGVLCLTNKAVNRCLYLLRKAGVAASGESGNPVDDDPAVVTVVAALRLADRPGDTAAAFRVHRSPLGPVVGIEDPHDTAHLGRVSQALRRVLLDDGYGRTLAGWTARLVAAGGCDERNASRLAQLVELADRFDAAPTLRPGDFADLVAGHRAEEPAPALVRVMTVHKAKGLEFDAVALPDLDVPLIKVREQLLVVRESPTGPVVAVHRSVQSGLRALAPELVEAQRQTEARRLRDSLCTLYVAMTRPRHGLYMFIRAGKAPGGPRRDHPAAPRHSGVLRATLSGGAPKAMGDARILHESGDPAWAAQLPEDRGSPSVPHAEPATGRPLPEPWSPAPAAGALRSWHRVSPSSLESQGRVRAADLLAIDRNPALRRGTVIHACFELVEHTDGLFGFPDRAALLRHARLAAPDEPAASLESLVAEFEAALERPGVLAALRRPELRRDEHAELWRERAFAERLDGPAPRVVRGQFDRVVVVVRGGRPVRAELLDFKTDAPDREAPPGLGHARSVEGYRPQIEAYKAVLRQMLGLSGDAVRATLLFVATGDAVEVR